MEGKHGLAVLWLYRKGENWRFWERIPPKPQLNPVLPGSVSERECDDRERQNKKQVRLKMQNQAKQYSLWMWRRSLKKKNSLFDWVFSSPRWLNSTWLFHSRGFLLFLFILDPLQSVSVPASHLAYFDEAAVTPNVYSQWCSESELLTLIHFSNTT